MLDPDDYQIVFAQREDLEICLKQTGSALI